ncbi:MAG: aminopeptidase P N-terminal domain-containing protein [Halieaceae bacterium]|jgi:Xaa-Pro aminopeptidase|nr:aminopeptidase P N-terminal domain-containing protein [Halieaceae bacterium]
MRLLRPPFSLIVFRRMVCLAPRACAQGRLFALLAALASPLAAAQYYQSDFPPEEFRARWERIFDRIGDNAVALVQGAPLARGFEYPRQTNSFYYLSGIETPHSYLWLDGRSREVTIFLPPRNEKLEQGEGRLLSAATSELVKRLVGVDHVASTEDMQGNWLREALAGDGSGNARDLPALYTPFRPEEGHAQSRYELDLANTAIANDHWDGRLPRELRLVGLLKARGPKPWDAPELQVRDLSPILDDLRMIKSDREIALIRRASEIAGLGVMEAIRSTEPGVYEYQLDAAARYVFLASGARLDGYRSITASGVENINTGHYFRNTRELRSGDLVLMDYAPDYRYYVSDIGRMWPVSGRFTAEQRELLEPILRYRDALIARIRPGVKAATILEEAAAIMELWFEANPFANKRYEAAAREMVEKGSGAFSHPVGMAVHDDGDYNYRRLPLAPGMVFSVDPTLRVAEENLYLRYEDTVVVTETGVENFTAFLPSELDDLEALMEEEGVVQKVRLALLPVGSEQDVLSKQGPGGA